MRTTTIILFLFTYSAAWCQTKYDSTALNATLKHLANYDENDVWSFFEDVSEKTGDIYFSMGDYRRALNYYDSCETKYRLKAVVCGSAYNMGYVPRTYKKFRCYLALNDSVGALRSMAHVMFDNFKEQFVDSLWLQHYVSVARAFYEEKLQCELDNALNSMHYSIDQVTDNLYSFPYTVVNCHYEIFNTKIHFPRYIVYEKHTSDHFTKKYFLASLRSTKAFRELLKGKQIAL